MSQELNAIAQGYFLPDYWDQADERHKLNHALAELELHMSVLDQILEEENIPPQWALALSIFNTVVQNEAWPVNEAMQMQLGQHLQRLQQLKPKHEHSEHWFSETLNAFNNSVLEPWKCKNNLLQFSDYRR